MENLKVKTWGVPFWTPGTVSDLARSRNVDSQGHRVYVVSEAPQSFMWANYCALLSVHLVLCPVLKKRKKKSEHPCLYFWNSSSDGSWPLQIWAGETRLLLLHFVTTSRQSRLGTGQSANWRNSGIRKKMYRKFWSMFEMRNSWRPQHIFTKSHLLWNVTVLMKVLWKC